MKAIPREPLVQNLGEARWGLGAGEGDTRHYWGIIPGPLITLEEAWAFWGLSLGSTLVCISAAILGRREQSFSEHLLCAIRHFTVPPGAP